MRYGRGFAREYTTRRAANREFLIGMLSFTIAHEMYHRGQLTVYERLLGIEPALTQFFKKAMSSRS
jgi:uncharacterized damage-inducible protein DinB